MRIIQFIKHLTIPHESNNQKARILHSSVISLIALVLISYQTALYFLPKVKPQVLGYAANISPDEVIRLTNEKRLQSGLLPLQKSSVLTEAAQAKGNDMLNKGYWAHVAPDGTTPWKFFNDFGYKYRYAGENLARDFSNPSSAVEAWMNSPSHRENLLSPKYSEIGIAVVEGNLGGVDTTIIVQFFGSRADRLPNVPVAKAETVKPISTSSPISSPQPQQITLELKSSTPTATIQKNQITEKQQVLVSPFNTTKGLSLITVGFLLIIMILDWIITARRKIVRIGGRTFAHLAFLGMILVIILILKAGKIL